MVVGGTKTPNLGKIRSLKPDLIVMDKEENPLPVYQELIAEGFTIFVSEVMSPSDVPQMLRELGKACGKDAAGCDVFYTFAPVLSTLYAYQGPHV